MNTHAFETKNNKNQSSAYHSNPGRPHRESISQLADNRPEAIQRKKLQQRADNHTEILPAQRWNDNKMSSTQLKTWGQLANRNTLPSIVQRQVIQFTIDELIAFVRDNDKKGFSAKLRSMKPGMDELISCEVAFDLARKAYNAGDLAEVRDICERADATRLPTEWTGARETLPSGEVSAWAHPTATVSTMPNHPWSMPTGSSGTHYRSTGHGTFNTERKTEVLSETGGAHKQQGAAIGFTLSRVAPPYAPGIEVNSAITSKEKDLFNAQRDAIKKLHPDYDPSLQQPRNAPWNKQRSVSPERSLPDQ